MLQHKFLDASDHAALLEFFSYCTNKPDVTVKERQTWGWILSHLGKKDVYISTLVEGSTIVMMNCSYTINAMWDLKQNSLDEWVMGLTRSREKASRMPALEIEDMMEPVLRVMEAQNRKAFYISRLVPAHLDWSTIEEYTTRVHPRSLKIDSYDSRTVHLIRSPDRVNELPLMYQSMIAQDWPEHKQAAIIRHDLQYKYRK